MSERKVPDRSGTHPPAAPSSQAEIAAFLDAVRKVPPARAEGAGRLCFALDATASRQATWSLACDIQADMFAAAAEHGGLELQLVYYRGARECRASPFLADAGRLKAMMGKISCEGGLTQIGRVLDHLAKEAERSGVRSAVFVGDALEEEPGALLDAAGRLAVLGVRLFVFQEGHDRRVERTYRELARLTGGAYCRFDAGAGRELRALLKAVAAYAAGGRSALIAARDPAAQRLLAAMGS